MSYQMAITAADNIVKAFVIANFAAQTPAVTLPLGDIPNHFTIAQYPLPSPPSLPMCVLERKDTKTRQDGSTGLNVNLTTTAYLHFMIARTGTGRAEDTVTSVMAALFSGILGNPRLTGAVSGQQLSRCMPSDFTVGDASPLMKKLIGAAEDASLCAGTLPLVYNWYEGAY